LSTGPLTGFGRHSQTSPRTFWLRDARTNQYEPAEPEDEVDVTMATYAIVKTGGKQYKVAVGDVVKVEKLDSEPGAKVSLPVALVVDGASVTSDSAALAKVAVTGEVLEHTKGPKIRIHKFKNKTGYHKRQGHRQQLTVLKVTGIK
jgi:ribosomal protein L21